MLKYLLVSGIAFGFASSSWGQISQTGDNHIPVAQGVSSTMFPEHDAFSQGRPTSILSGPAWGSYTGNWQGVTVNVGSYPSASLFGSGIVPIVEALVGLVNVPLESRWHNHAAGVAGYGRSASRTQGGVGVFGWAMMAADGVQGWGANFGVTNCGNPNCINSEGHTGATLYGMEIDVNIAPLQGNRQPTGGARGIYIVGASSVRPTSGLTGIEFDSPGIGTAPHMHWTELLKSADGSADAFATVGAMDERTSVASGSQPIIFRSRPASGSVQVGALMQDAAGTLVLASASGAAVSGGPLTLQPSGSGAGQASVGLDLVGMDRTGARHAANVTADADGNLIISSHGIIRLLGEHVDIMSPAHLKSMLIAQHTPASSSEPCVPGQMSDDEHFHYWCASKNHWLRVVGSTFP